MIVTLNLNKIIIFAQEEAERLQNKQVEPEHLLLGILRLGEGSAYDLLCQTAFQPEEAKQQLDQSLRKEEQMVEPVIRSAKADRILRIAEGISRE